MKSYNTENLTRLARVVRATLVQMAHDGREGHLNGAMSCVELLLGIYHHWLNIDPADPKNPERDRFIFSKGHACSALYAVMATRGFFPPQDLLTYCENDSRFPSHPCTHALPLLEWSSGSLGHGAGVGTGIAYALKLRNSGARVATLISDGECNEGSTWETAAFAAANQLDNFLLIVDNNGTQAVGRSDILLGGTSLEEKFRAFGWGTVTIQGNDMREVLSALDEVPFRQGSPSAIIAQTVAGAGVSFMQDQILWHYRVPSAEDLKNALIELEEAPLVGGAA